jgi:D-sedoheptulose 7-phosphate isomerase
MKALVPVADNGQIEEILKAYTRNLCESLTHLPFNSIAKLVRLLAEARDEGKTVYLLGNGGSASTASHFACDLAKGAIRDGLLRVRAVALTDNVSLITAWGNDVSFERIFVEQLANVVQRHDIVIGISTSGNSKNVLAAIELARRREAHTIGLVGEVGGKLANLVDLCIRVPSPVIQQVEDVHLVIQHMISVSLPTIGIDREKTRRAIFIDRDGVINVEKPDYVRTWGQFEFLPGSLRALSLLRDIGLPILIVTNQSAVNRGLLDRASLEKIHERMKTEIETHGGRVDAIFYCPHTPDQSCECRKPRPGLLLRASSEMGIDLQKSYFIGDAATDAVAAASVGCAPLILRRRGRGQRFSASSKVFPRGTIVLEDLPAAARYIAKIERGTGRPKAPLVEAV